MKKLSALLLSAALLLSSLPARAAETSAAEKLHSLGLFQGTDKGFELERTVNRAEGAAVLVRLLGREEDAKWAPYYSGLNDVSGWAAPYINYARNHGYVRGTSEYNFSPDAPMTAEGYLSFLLRTLGYTDTQGDYTYDTALQKAAELGLLTAQEVTAYAGKPLTRGEMAELSLRALSAKVRDSERTLAETLVTRGIFTKEAALAAGLTCAVETGARAIPAGRYTEGFCWDRPLTPVYPITILSQAPDLNDPLQAAGDGVHIDPYGSGPRIAFAAVDGSWTTEYQYYLGFSGSNATLGEYGILAIADEHHWAMLDHQGRERYRVERKNAFAFYHDYPIYDNVLFAADEEGGRSGCYDLATGEALDFDRFAGIRSFREGLGAATLDGETWGYIDMAGTWVIQPQFARPEGFQYGRAVVRLAGTDRWAVIDRDGKRLMEQELDEYAELTAIFSSETSQLYRASSGDGTVLCWYDETFRKIPASIDGHEVRECAGGGLWYDDGGKVTLFYGGETYTFPTGCPVAKVENGLVLLREGSPEYWNEPTIAARLDGSYVFPAGEYDHYDLVTDAVTGKTYIEAGDDTTFQYYDRDGKLLWGNLMAKPSAAEIALELGFTPDPASGAFLVGLTIM